MTTGFYSARIKIMKKQMVIISLGGSNIVPDSINVQFLKKFRQVILGYVKNGNKVLFVCGGGKTCRNYQNALKKVRPNVSSEELDWMGIESTYLNAFLVWGIFGNEAERNILTQYDKKLKTNKKIIVGGGWRWHGGHSTDYATAIAAKTYGVKTIVNISNIDYVYHKDPRQFKDAKPFENLTWAQYRKIVGDKWVPGKNAPFDPKAARFSQKNKLRVVFVKGDNISNLKNFLEGKKFKGTVIK
jgi:uridylate kinase